MGNSKRSVIEQQIEEMMTRKRDRLAIERAALAVCQALNIEPEAKFLILLIAPKWSCRRNVDAVGHWIRERVPYPTPNLDTRAISALADLLELQLDRGTDSNAHF